MHNRKWLLTSVYGPNNSQRRDDFSKEMDMIRGRWNGAWCIGGDWNIIKFRSEKLGGSQLRAEMRRFSDWINSHSLVDLQLRGALHGLIIRAVLPCLGWTDFWYLLIGWKPT